MNTISSILYTRLCSESANLRQGVQLQQKVIQDSNPYFLINPDSDRAMSDRCQNVVDSLSCRRVSFRRVSKFLYEKC